MAAVLSPSDLAVDHDLAEIAQSFRFLLDLTPVDVSEHRASYLAGERAEPEFTYRELEDDPAVISERLAAVELGDVEDPILATLLRDKHREIELQVEMLEARGTDDFLPLSLELYGGVAQPLRDRAFDVLGRVAAPVDGAGRTEEHVDAEQFARLAGEEVDHYRSRDPDISMHVEVRPDVAGVSVSGDDLLISDATSVRVPRIRALLQHEVGTHLLTHVNGSHQPVRLMAAGLAGYEETQEGLATFAEHLVGGLTPFRLRQLAGRVVAVDRMVAGESYTAVLDCLIDLGFPPGTAFTMAARAFRSGGLTKDVIYLRGLTDIVEHVGKGGTLDLLWLGKFSLRDLPLVDDLRARGALVEPRLVPRYLEDPAAVERLDHAADLTDITDLIRSTP